MVFTQCSRKSPFINAMASAVAIASFASDVLPAQASVSETKAEIRELRDQLRRLERRLETQEHKNGSEAKGSRRGKGTDKEEATAYVGKFVYKGIEITPGGYFAGNTVFRNHWMGSDTATNWGNTPYLNNPAAHTEEFRFTARQSQLSLRVRRQRRSFDAPARICRSRLSGRRANRQQQSDELLQPANSSPILDSRPQ